MSKKKKLNASQASVTQATGKTLILHSAVLKRNKCIKT